MLEKFKHTSSSMERTFREWSDSTPKKLLETLKNQQIGTEEQIKASTSHKLEQTLAEMRADNERLQEKIGLLQLQYSDKLAEKNKNEEKLQIRVRELSSHLHNQKIAVGTIIRKIQQARLIIANLREEAQQNMTKMRS